MKNTLLLALVIIPLSCTTPDKNNKEQSIVVEIFSPEENGYKLVWEDNFDGDKLDTAKWRIRGVGPRRIGYNDTSMVAVSDGNLLLMYDIKKDSILGSAVGTGQTFLTKYGYFECRAQLQKSIGPWSAFWIQSPNISGGEDPSVYGAEIDIFEYFKELGNDNLTHCIHWAYGDNPQSSGQMNSTHEGLDEGFHTFGLEWTEKSYNFYIDGKKYHEQSKGISNVEEYMILSMELPPYLEGIKNACAPDTFKVDYVKVFKKQ
ncbi:MAG: glycoside hydrolase family 16 protein [Bacteroidales bacterium]|nr:glycoside hydrolase family 16 protein [Bacteroidales bacterium]